MSCCKNLIVLKFGGSILRSGSDYVRVAQHVKELVNAGFRVVVVVSAMKGITDLLSLVASSRERVKVLKEVISKHLLAIREVGSDGVSKGQLNMFSEVSAELAKVAWAIDVLGEVTPRVRDYVLSFGEVMSSVIMSLALRSQGVSTKWFTGRQAGIVTDDNYGEANPIHEVSAGLVRERLCSLIREGAVPVVTGFVAGTLDGSVTVLGRGGSDFTATLLARYLGASEVRLYTDVPGVMSADPELVPNARVIDVMSFNEAMELAYLGAKKFHPRTFEPLVGTDIAVRVTSLHTKGEGGTLITEEGGGPPLKAVVVLNDLSVVSVVGARMVGRLGTAAEVAVTAARAGVNIVGIVQPVSEISISLIVNRVDAARLVNALTAIVRKGVVRDVTVEDVVAVSVVGEGLKDPRFVSEVINWVSEEPLSIVSWYRGDVSLTLTFNNVDKGRVARILHSGVLRYG